MSFVKSLQCKECGTAYPVEPKTICDNDFGPLEVCFNYDQMQGHVTRESIEAGPLSLWRYRDLLPIEGDPVVGLKSGFTPLVKADNLAREIGVSELYIKDDSTNYPTFSYKDRVVSVALTKAMAADYVDKNIRVNCVNPGTTLTPSLQDRINAFDNPDEAKKMFIARQPIGRLGEPDEIAKAIVYLASDDASFVTGAILNVDGGLTI